MSYRGISIENRRNKLRSTMKKSKKDSYNAVGEYKVVVSWEIILHFGPIPYDSSSVDKPIRLWFHWKSTQVFIHMYSNIHTYIVQFLQLRFALTTNTRTCIEFSNAPILNRGKISIDCNKNLIAIDIVS